MYKKTQEQTDHIDRIGSAATRPSARGIFHDIPEWAQQPEKYFNSLTESYNIANKQLFALRSRSAWLKLRLKTNQATKGEVIEYREDVCPLIEKFEQELDSLRHAATAAAKTSWSTIFFFQAKKMLDANTFDKINSTTRDILLRERTPSQPRLKPTKKELRKAIYAWP